MPNKRLLLAGICALLPLLVFPLVGPLVGQDVTASREAEDGSVVTQFIGRFLLGADGTGEVIGYVPLIEGIGNNLFSGTERSERTAFFSVRSNRIAFTRVPNGSFNHFLLSPAVAGQAIEYTFYFNPNPDRNFADAATFTTGQRIATFRVRNGMLTTTLADSIYVANFDLVDSQTFTYDNRKLNFRNLGRSVVTRIVGPVLPTIVSGSLSVPLAGDVTLNGK